MTTKIIDNSFYSERLVRFSYCDPAGIVFPPSISSCLMAWWRTGSKQTGLFNKTMETLRNETDLNEPFKRLLLKTFGMAQSEGRWKEKHRVVCIQKEILKI